MFIYDFFQKLIFHQKPLNFNPNYHAIQFFACASAQNKRKHSFTWCEALSSIFGPQGDPPGRLRTFLKNLYLLKVLGKFKEKLKRDPWTLCKYIFNCFSNFSDLLLIFRSPFQIPWLGPKMFIYDFFQKSIFH